MGSLSLDDIYAAEILISGSKPISGKKKLFFPLFFSFNFFPIFSPKNRFFFILVKRPPMRQLPAHFRRLKRRFFLSKATVFIAHKRLIFLQFSVIFLVFFWFRNMHLSFPAFFFSQSTSQNISKPPYDRENYPTVTVKMAKKSEKGPKMS